MENNDDNGNKKKKGAMGSSSNQKSKRASMNAQVKNVSKAFGVRAIRPLGASSNKQSTKGAMEVDTLAGFVIIVIFIVVIITIMLKNKEFIQRLLP